jgi:serine/threonine-protein kinase HipA
MRAGKVYVNGKFAGVLTEEGPARYTFSYDKDYLQLPHAQPVCIAMPLREETYESSVLFPFFSNMLSEGANRAFQTQFHGLRPDDDFGLLLKTAAYDTIGAVTVKEISL